MSETMMDRLARALYEEWERLDPSQETIRWDDVSEIERPFYLYCVRAILAELREPSERMINSVALLTMTGGDGKPYHTTFDEEEARSVWQAQIDAILKEDAG